MTLLQNKFIKAISVATLATAGLLSVQANAATYELDPHHTTARFFIDHFGTSTNTGGFYGLSGEIEYSPAENKGFVGITIPIASLDTGIAPFTKHLKSADFFNVEQYPTAYFKSTKWNFENNKVSTIDGELTLLGQTHPVTLTATKFNCYDSPILKKQVCGGDFETTIDRTQWGMNTFANIAMMKDVKLVIQAEGAIKE